MAKKKQLNFSFTGDFVQKNRIGDLLTFALEMPDTVVIDSAIFYVNNKFVGRFDDNLQYRWNTQNARVGRQQLKAGVFHDGELFVQFTNLVLLSDIEPEMAGYRVVKMYPHDPHAFTQGLLFENGYFYEATGLKGASSLRKVNLEKGEVIQSFTVPRTIFGEGIATFDDKIVQLSWRSNTGFVYEKQSFKLLSKFSYPTEGWGLTYDGKDLIMSDGTHILYKLETGSFSEVDRIEVYDNSGIVSELNELEFIKGELYANKYMTDTVVRIEPTTGKVLGYIDFSGLLDDKYRKPDTDVLNGIAYDVENERLFVTGKKWPKLFHVEIK